MTNASLLNIGVSGLNAYRAALATTGQNITNAATPGYSRQRVEIESQTLGGGTGGAGSRVIGVTRILDEIAIGQLRMDTSAFNELATLGDEILRIDRLLSDDNSSLNQGFNRFFGALQSSIHDPNSLPVRQLVISEARGLIARFNSLDERLRTQLEDIGSELTSTTARVNELARSVAELNGRIQVIDTATGSPNELLDQRDELLRQLAELVNVQIDGDHNVFIGKGQPLVVGERAGTLGVTEAGEITFMVQGRDTEATLTDSISGGRLGGLLVTIRSILEPSLDQLGRVAIAFANSANEVHSRGISLSGNFGGLFFTDVNDPADMARRAVPLTNSGSVAPIVDVRIDDANKLEATDYELAFDNGSSGHFFVTRGSDGEIVHTGVLTGELPQEVTFDGLTLVLGGGEYAGNRFSIQATRRGAENIGLVLKDPSELALAAPVRLESNPTNGGTGSINLAAIDGVDHAIFSGLPDLVPPLLIRFTSPTRYDILDNSDPLNPIQLVPALEGLNYLPGTSNALLPGTGQTVTQSSGNNVGAFPAVSTIVAGLSVQSNGYDAESVTFYQDDPLGGSPVSIQAVNIAAGSSARLIAQQLNGVPGVNTSAYTEMRITSLNDNGIGEQLALVINGVRFDQPGMTLNSLADAISANDELIDQGIIALSDGQTLTLSSTVGDDLAVHVSGDVSDSIEFESMQGQSMILSGVGPGVAATTVGSINVAAGVDFSVGGPHSFTVTIDNQPAVTITLNTAYSSGVSLAAGIQDALDATVLSGEVSVGSTSSGELRFSTIDTGSGTSIELSAVSSGVASTLGLATQGSVGVDNFRTMTTGGRVNLLLDPGRSMTSDVANPAGNVFTRNPVTNPAGFGFDITMAGRPVAGDTFTIEFNDGGVLDNRNGQNLADLRLDKLLGDPPLSFSDSYASLVEFIGIKASQTGIDRDAIESLLEQSTARRNSVSGVNLDEEAANLIWFEQAYNAASRVISVARDTFDVLLNAIG